MFGPKINMSNVEKVLRSTFKDGKYGMHRQSEKDKAKAKIYTLYATEREEEFLKGEEMRLSSLLKFRWYEMGTK
jgi:hypothetical protein